MNIEDGVFMAAITALAGVVAFLWKRIDSTNEQTRKDLKECQDDRERLWKEIARISGESFADYDEPIPSDGENQ